MSWRWCIPPAFGPSSCRSVKVPKGTQRAGDTANVVHGEFFGRHVPVARIDDLLTMKRAANRDKDRLDIEALEKIKRGEDPNA